MKCASKVAKSVEFMRVSATFDQAHFLLDGLPIGMEKNTTSLWLGTAQAPQFKPLQRDGIHVDVVIVGAGITGLTAAILLKERGKTVAVLEKERVAGGETGNTTAHI